MEKVAYDPQKDLAPVTLVAKVPEMLVVDSSVPANNMAELIALAKAEPGKLNFASTGPGRPAASRRRIVQAHGKNRHRARALSRRRSRGQRSARPSGADDVPRSAHPAAADQGRRAAGDRDRRAGTRARPRLTCRPPPKSGCPNVLVENWYGMVAPAGTPPAIIASLNKIATEAMRDPTVKEKLAVQGAELVGDTPEHFRDFIESETGNGRK